MFWTQQAVFSVTRNIFGNAKPLARKGVENASEVVVFTGATVARPEILAGEGFSNALRKNNAYFEGKIAISKRESGD